MANDFSSDPNCVALWKLENNANDAKGGNHLTTVNSPSYDSGDKKEGNYCIDLESGSSQYAYRTDADLDAGFPGKSGTSEQSFSICFWAKPKSLVAYMRIISKWANGASFCWGVYLYSDNKLRFLIGYNSGASYTGMSFGTALTAGRWYHVAVVYDASTNGMKIRIWDDYNGALLGNNATGTAGGDMSPTSDPLQVGRDGATTTYYYDGRLDEVVFFKDVLTDVEIDAIRAGTYGTSATEKSSSDTGTGVDAVESLQTPQAKTSSDTGSGAEGTPSQSAILAGGESGSGADAVDSLQTPQAKTSSDAGSGAEGTLTQSAVLASSESGSGLEALIARLLSGEESGGAVEAADVDTEGLLKDLFAGEAGEGSDQLVAKIEMPIKGGGMKLWT